MADFKSIEKKWQENWEKAGIFKVKEDKKKKKFYCLEMFPYPSGSGLHMGHALNYTIGDIYARFKRMQGYNVLYPMGYDSLGLPAENAAIKEGVHPYDYTEKSTKNFIKQQKALGLSYDWDRLIKTHDPAYYRWDQWIFLKMFEKGLAFRKKASVNWCPKCNSVLANEQVHNGKCWRHSDTSVEIKHLEQWFFKITNYAEELYDKIDSLENWASDVKAMQKNWIGKSYGTEIKFKINGEDWPIFTTRPDTIYGVTFMVVSAQHPRLNELVTKEQKKEVDAFLKKIKSTSEKDLGDLDKEGAFTGSYAINPITGEKVPVYAGNFVVADYGAGMVMAVPAHDQRDFEFATKYKIDIKSVIVPRNLTEYQTGGGDIAFASEPDANFEKIENDIFNHIKKRIQSNSWDKVARAYTGSGILINSDKFNGLDNEKAKDEITKFLEKQKAAKKVVQYKLRDWLISRQRYWGTPIPIIYCEKCGIVPVPEKDLPVELPRDVKFGQGNPLLTNEKFVNVKCPKCKSPAKRETDTMDTFVNSSWYFLRYTDPKNGKLIFDKDKAKYWMPIDLYIGGKEHACMHLIYFRFYTKFLRDLGLLDFDEPTYRLFNQGMLHGDDGFVMSKSRGNVVLPEAVSEKYGIDTARLFLMSMASPDKDVQWSDKGIDGSLKFIFRVISYFDSVKIGKSSKKAESKLNKTIKEYTKYIEELKYNLALICLRELFDNLENEQSKDTLEKFLKMLNPFCPHITEELWEKLGNKPFITLQSWPVCDEKKIDEKLDFSEVIFENTKKDIYSVMELTKIIPQEIELIISSAWKYDLYKKVKEIVDATNTRNVSDVAKEIMKTDLKRYGQDIMKMIPKLLEKVPEVILTQKDELSAFENAKKSIEAEFKCSVRIVKAEDSKEQKAKAASPGKPAILIK